MNTLLKTNCTFCSIIEGKIPCDKVYENDYVLVFKDINPDVKCSEHVLLIPKVHLSSILDQEGEEGERYCSELIKAIPKVAQVLRASNFKCHINTGSKAGQIVFHLHLHLKVPK